MEVSPHSWLELILTDEPFVLIGALVRGGEAGGVGGPGPEAPPPPVLRNGWAFKRERLSCVWSGPQQGGDDF